MITKTNTKMKTNKGITLIALVITVIVLLILAGAAISISINGNNIFERANEAVARYNNKVELEEAIINDIWRMHKGYQLLNPYEDWILGWVYKDDTWCETYFNDKSLGNELGWSYDEDYRRRRCPFG